MADEPNDPGDESAEDGAGGGNGGAAGGMPPQPPEPGDNPPVAIEDEVRSSFLAYSMSVIISRALPDVRDGLKPVHRRILYAMNQEGLLPNRPYSKSAGVVGEVRRDLQADEPVGTAGAVVDGPKNVGRLADVRNGQRLIACRRIGMRGGIEKGEEGLVVVVGAGDRLLEDGRVRRHTEQPILFDHPVQAAREQQAAADVVVPDALTVLLDVDQGVAHLHSSAAAGFGAWFEGLEESLPSV